MIPFPRLLAVGTLAAGLVASPLSAFAAATPQQLLTQALVGIRTTTPNIVQGTADIRVVKTPLIRGAEGSTQAGTIGFTAEGAGGTSKDFQGFVELKSGSQTAGTETQALALPTPPRLSFRSTGGSTYLRLENLSGIFAGLGLPLGGEQLAPFERWMRFDLSAEERAGLPVTISASTQALPSPTGLKAAFALAEKNRINPLLALSSKRLPNQTAVWSIQSRVNPAFIALLEREALKAAGKDAVKRRAIQAEYKEMRESLVNGLRLALIVDARDAAHPRLTRVEFVAKDAQTVTGCGYARYKKNGDPVYDSFSCTLKTHRETLDARGALNFSAKPGIVVEAPAEAVSIKDAITQAFQLLFGAPTEDAAEQTEDAS